MSTNAVSIAPANSAREDRLRELMALYPEPDWRAYAADRAWLAEQQNARALDAHVGRVVAAYEQRVVAVGDDYTDLLIELSERFGVHPGRIVVVGIE